MPSSPMKVSKKKRASPRSTKVRKEADDLKSEEAVETSPPPLEVELNSLSVAVDLNAVDLTNEDSDKENESAHSLSPPSKSNGNYNTNNKPEADSDDDSDSDDDDSDSDDEDESSSDDDNPLFMGMDKEMKKALKAKMKGIQAGYDDVCEEERKRRIAEIKRQIHFNLAVDIDEEQATFIDAFVEEHKVNLQEKLQDEGIFFLESINEMMEQQKAMNDDDDNTNNSNNNNNNNFKDMEGDYEFPEDDDDEEWMVETKKRKREYAKKRKNIPKNTNLDGSKRCGRLLLNDALKNIKDQSKWSEARQKAWKNRKTHQNAYFYRFNVPGQPQRNGKWTKSEHELFMKRALEMGVNDQWGIFSKVIPGRVGYQCSNYWRGLVKDGDVIDPNYRIDNNNRNKLHFLRKIKNFKISNEHKRFAITIKRDISGVWKDLPMRHPKHPSDEYCEQVQQAVAGLNMGGNGGGGNKRKNKKKRKRNEDDSDEEYGATQKKRRRRNRNRNNDDDGDEAFYCKASTDVVIVEDDNPIPEFNDIMTGMPVVKPAISPYGHVLGYDTWTKILRTSKQKNMCPFTLQKMTRRSLVKLTKANIEDYRDKIVNLSAEQVQLMNTINKED